MENSNLFSIDELKIETRSLNKIISNFYDELINYHKIKWLSNHEKFDHDIDYSFEKSKLLQTQKDNLIDYVKNQVQSKELQVNISFDISDPNVDNIKMFKLKVQN
jgi:hypothetical protein